MPFSLQSLQCLQVFFVLEIGFERLADTTQLNIRAALVLMRTHLIYIFIIRATTSIFLPCIFAAKIFKYIHLWYNVLVYVKLNPNGEENSKIHCGVLGRLKSLTLSTARAALKLNMQLLPMNVSLRTYFSCISRYLAAGGLIGASMREEKKRLCCGQCN